MLRRIERLMRHLTLCAVLTFSLPISKQDAFSRFCLRPPFRSSLIQTKSTHRELALDALKQKETQLSTSSLQQWHSLKRSQLLRLGGGEDINYLRRPRTPMIVQLSQIAVRATNMSIKSRTLLLLTVKLLHINAY